MSFNERYAKEESKTFTPPEGVQSAARKALKWIEEGHAGSGFTGVGRGRAHQLANGEAVSLSTIKRMHSYFSRHRVDKQGKDWDKPSAGKVAWYAWGGDAGASWAKSIAEKHDGNKKTAFGPDLHTSLEIGKAGWSAVHGVGQVLKDTFMFPANAAESARNLVHEVSTGNVPNPPKNDYYGWGPKHLTPTEVGGAALYPVKKGLDAVINKGLDLKDRYDQAMHPEDRARRMTPPTAAKFKSCTNCDNSVPANTLDSEGKCKDGCKASMQRMRDRASENLFWNE